VRGRVGATTTTSIYLNQQETERAIPQQTTRYRNHNHFTVYIKYILYNCTGTETEFLKVPKIILQTSSSPRHLAGIDTKTSIICKNITEPANQTVDLKKRQTDKPRIEPGTI